MHYRLRDQSVRRVLDQRMNTENGDGNRYGDHSPDTAMRFHTAITST